jgi:SAM-dependent methyltransferase
MKSDTINLFDRELYLARRRKSWHQPADGMLCDKLAEDLLDRLMMINRQFTRTLLISDRPQKFVSVLEGSRKFASIHHLMPTASDELTVDGRFDCIISMLDLHTVNDVPGHLAQIAKALNPDGLFLASLFAGESLHELRTSWLEAESELSGGASYRIAPMIGVRELGALLQRAQLALPVADVDQLVLRYDTALDLMREIKLIGLGSSMRDRRKQFVTKSLLMRVGEIYKSRFSDSDARVRATVDVAWAHAWKPHASQQQPLKPGSAKTRLSEALKVPEQKL